MSTVIGVIKLVGSCLKQNRGVYESMDKLKSRLKELNSQKRDIVSRLDAEQVRGETTLRDEVMRWLANVEKMNEEVMQIEEAATRARCFACASVGRSSIHQKIEAVKRLSKKGQFPDGLIISPPRPPGDDTRGKATIPGSEKAEEIWACLTEDDEARKIGVCGMGGIGKTTALKHVHNRLLEEKDKFDNVVWVTVSRCSSITSFQDKLAMRLDLDISNDVDETTRAAKLYKKFDEKKRYVLILDDMWEAYDLQEVGIPEPSSANGCKLILTTRSLDVCRRMACKPILMEVLREDKALDLFYDRLGHNASSRPELNDHIIKEITRECAGLPLAIVTIAGSLRGTDDYEVFKIALAELRESTKSSMFDGVYDRLKFTFDRLSDRNLQDCLLYCALYPEHYEIERGFFIEHLIAEGILMNEKEIRQHEIRKGHVMLNKLVNFCLLVDTVNSKGEKCVMMHDLVRDMVLQMSTVSPQYLVKAGVGLKKIPDEKCWNHDLVKVSLMANDICDIPPSLQPPICPKISTLLLAENVNLRCISDEFFLHMKGLKILDLSYNYCLENLPKSISELVALTALFLGGCKLLRYVPSLAKLGELKRLDLKDSGIHEVPQGIEMLINLRYLNLDARILKIVPGTILRNLSNLQYISFNRYGDGPRLRAEELDNMGELESFEGVLSDISNFNAYVRSMAKVKPMSYVLQLGFIRGSPCAPVSEGSKVVYFTSFNFGEQVAKHSECPLVLPRDVEILAIEKCNINVTTLCELISFENAASLRWCWIGDCGELEHLVSCSSSATRHLQSLERLELEGVRDFRGLIRSTESSPSSLSTVPPTRTFSSLKVLKIRSCNNLKALSLSPLPNLEEIYVLECENLVKITATMFENDGEADIGEEIKSVHHDAVLNLPNLRELHFSDLPNLQSVPSFAYSVKQVVMQGCPKLERIHFLEENRPFPDFKIDDDDKYLGKAFDPSMKASSLMRRKMDIIS